MMWEKVVRIVDIGGIVVQTFFHYTYGYIQYTKPIGEMYW
jgi:hypothetical protein